MEASLWQQVQDTVEVRFDTRPVAIVETPDAVSATLRTGSTGEVEEEMFDLVVGADGLRSTVRRLAFGPDERYLKSLDAVICAFQLSGRLPRLGEHEGAIVAESKRAPCGCSTLARRTPPGCSRTGPGTLPPSSPVLRPRPSARSSVTARGWLVGQALTEAENAPTCCSTPSTRSSCRTGRRAGSSSSGPTPGDGNRYSGMGATNGILGGAVPTEQLAAHPDDLAAAPPATRPSCAVRHQAAAPQVPDLRTASGPPYSVGPPGGPVPPRVRLQRKRICGC